VERIVSVSSALPDEVWHLLVIIMGCHGSWFSDTIDFIVNQLMFESLPYTCESEKHLSVFFLIPFLSFKKTF
jgi:hypothetical protein